MENATGIEEDGQEGGDSRVRRTFFEEAGGMTGEVGRRLMALRKAQALKQAQIAKLVHVRVHEWSEWEKGTQALPAPVAMKIAEQFKVTLDWIYLGKTAMMPARLLALIKAAEGAS